MCRGAHYLILSIFDRLLILVTTKSFEEHKQNINMGRRV